MKIVFLTPAYAPDLGGVETHVQQVARVLTDSGHQLTIITLTADKNLPSAETKNGLQVYRLLSPALSGANQQIGSGSASFLQKWQFKRQLWQQLARLEPHLVSADVIHVHDVWWWLVPNYWRFRKKIFITFHGWEGQFPVKLTAKIQRYVAAKLSRGTIHVGAWIQEFYWDRPRMITYGGVSDLLLKKTSASLTPAKSKKNIPVLKICFIGRLEQSNDLQLYLDLLQQLAATGRRFEMTWIGDGKWRAACQRWGRVTGMLAQPEATLAQADLVFASSYLSILTAQALGKIVCAFSSTAIKQRYLATYPGVKYLLMANDVRSMNKSILKILNNHQLRWKMAKNARQFAETRPWTEVTQQYLKLWMSDSQTQTFSEE